MDDGNSFLYSSIYALVRIGFYTTVWYKFIPFEMEVPPEAFLYISPEYFLNDGASVPGYTKITLQETKDISDIVMSVREDTPFQFIDNTGVDNPTIVRPQQDPEIPIDNINRKWRVAVSLGVVITFFLAIGVYPE